MTTKVLVNGAFKADGEEHQSGETVELSDETAQAAIEKGYAEETEEVGEVEEIGTTGETEDTAGGDNEPVVNYFVGVSDSRNFRIKVLPAEALKYDSPGVVIEESRQDDDDNWTSESFWLPTGANLLTMAKALEESWKTVQELRS